MHPDHAAPSGCNLCGSPRRRQIFKKFGYSIVRCLECGLETLHPLPSAAELAAFYDEGYFKGNPERRGYLDYVAEGPLRCTSFASKLERMEALLVRSGYHRPGTDDPAPPLRLLDVGAAAGWMLKAAEGRGWDATGLEVSAYACDEARIQGLTVTQGDSLEVFAGRQFDAITMWDVLEHLRDPMDSLRQAHALLEEGGMLVFSTGDVGCLWSRMQGRHHRAYNPPQHLYYFTRKTMTEMAARAGFEVMRIEPDEKVTQLHYILHIARNLVDFRPLEIVFDLLLRLLPDRPVKISLRDNLVVYLQARRSTSEPPPPRVARVAIPSPASPPAAPESEPPAP